MNQFVNILQEWVAGMVILALPVITGFAIALLKLGVDRLMQQIEENRPNLRYAIKEAVELGVRSAEQMELSGFIDDKKAHASAIAQRWLDSQGWEEIDMNLVGAAIEASVLEQFNMPEGGRSGFDW